MQIPSNFQPLISSDHQSVTESEKVNKDKTVEVGQRALEQLILPSDASILSDEDGWVVISNQQNEKAVSILIDEEKLKTLVSMIVEFEGEEWVMVENNGIESISQEKRGWMNQWAITGGIPLLGAAIGTVQQLAGSQVGLSFLQGLNLLKQLEIKNCAYFIPASPIFIDLAQKVYRDSSTDPFHVKVVRATKSLDKKEVAFNLLSIGLSLATAGSHQAMMKAGITAFDLSGHIMTKVVSSALLAKGVASQEGEENSSSLKKAALYGYATSDALMLQKTALRFHTPEEVAAGALWGLINLGIAHTIVNYVTSSSTISDPIDAASSLAIAESSEQESILPRLTQESNSAHTPEDCVTNTDDSIVTFFTDKEELSQFINDNYYT